MAYLYEDIKNRKLFKRNNTWEESLKMKNVSHLIWWSCIRSFIFLLEFIVECLPFIYFGSPSQLLCLEDLHSEWSICSTFIAVGQVGRGSRVWCGVFLYLPTSDIVLLAVGIRRGPNVSLLVSVCGCLAVSGLSHKGVCTLQWWYLKHLLFSWGSPMDW